MNAHLISPSTITKLFLISYADYHNAAANFSENIYVDHLQPSTPDSRPLFRFLSISLQVRLPCYSLRACLDHSSIPFPHFHTAGRLIASIGVVLHVRIRNLDKGISETTTYNPWCDAERKSMINN